jgi:AcrR family transcriptional regulator
MGSVKKRKGVRAGRYHHGDLRRALLAAAVGILRRRGGKALTLREAARRAGVSQTAPYRHFRDKEALLAAVAEDGFRSLRDAIGAAGSAPEPFAKLRAMSVAYVRFAAEHPQHYRVMFSPEVRGSRHPPLREAAVSAFSELLPPIVEGLGIADASSDEVGARAMAVWALVHGLSLLAIDDQVPPIVKERVPLDRLTEAVARVLVEGLGRAPAPPATG